MGIVLASASPRRKRLLAVLVKRFLVAHANADERVRKGEAFPHAARRLAELKATSVARRNKAAVVIGADTIAYIGRKNFRKAGNVAKARESLLHLSGRAHFVVTGMCVIFPGGRKVSFVEKASVRMRRLDGKMLEWYLKTGEWKGRAGCYDVSGKGRRLVESVKGERETVIGLPLKRLRRILSPHNAPL